MINELRNLSGFPERSCWGFFYFSHFCEIISDLSNWKKNGFGFASDLMVEKGEMAGPIVFIAGLKKK